MAVYGVKDAKVAVAAVVLLFVAATAGWAQETTRIAVAQATTTIDRTYDRSVAYEIRNKLIWLFPRIGAYDVCEVPREIDTTDIEQVRRYAEENRIDVVIYGHVHREGDQHFFVTMEVYERYHGEVTLVVQEETEELNYLSAMVDRVAHQIVEGYSGEVLRFGTLRVSVSPRGIGYRVYVDGERMEDDVRQIEYVLAGEREVEIRQERMFGEVVVASRRVDLADGETVRIDATLPERTEREAEALAAIDRRTGRSAWSRAQATDGDGLRRGGAAAARRELLADVGGGAKRVRGRENGVGGDPPAVAG